MHDSPRIRRLRNDHAALSRLASESSVFQFKTSGSPPSQYQITFKGKGLCRDRGKVKIVQTHRVEIKLGTSYPRTMPEIRWLTPVYHPNISEIGMVCLGGYGTHWVPSVQLDELCMMLWDMARYHNYDIRSPYNRDAALWVANQTSILFPTDPRPIRDLRVAQGRIETPQGGNGVSSARSAFDRVRQFIQQYGGGNGGLSVAEPTPTPTPTPPASTSEFPPPPAVPPAPAQDERSAELRTFIAHVEAAPRQGEELVIVENWEDRPDRPSRPDHPAEEIFFIE